MKLKSTTQIALDNLIFTPTKRSRNKPKPIPTASEVKSYDPTYPLIAKRWLRVKARRKMAKQPRRRCKNEECREWFHPAFANQWWCCADCGTKIALERRSKEREKAEKAADKKRRREEQQQKDKLKIRKLALKPSSYWIKQAQQAVNAFIRERDRDLPCISCGTFTSAQWDAGHYRTTAAAPQLRFDERNIHKQCVVCNQHKSGNLVPYRVMLIDRIGNSAVDEIESDHKRHRWTVEECKAIKSEYQQKLKDLQRERGESA